MLPQPKAGPSAEGLAHELERMIAAQIASNQLQVPAIPAVAMKCLASMRAASFSLRQAAEIIEKDPVLTAQVIRISNSAAMATRERVRSVIQGVTRLGLVKLRMVLVEASARQLFQSKDPRIARAAQALWEHSLAVAVVARDACALERKADPELAYIAGLLHDIGKPLVAAMLLDAEKARARAGVRWLDADDWINVVQRVHRKLGVALARKWEMPEAVTNAINDCGEGAAPHRADAAPSAAASPEPSITDAVRLANALAKQQQIYIGPSDTAEVDGQIEAAASRFGLNAQQVAALATDLKQKIAALMA